jgi:Mrr N-terminal domain
MSAVKHWVWDLERGGFWLPLTEQNFYPDVVAELNDGPILALEHKAEVYATNDDSKEKCTVGALWEETSNDKALFLMTVKEKDMLGLYQQIEAKIVGKGTMLMAIPDYQSLMLPVLVAAGRDREVSIRNIFRSFADDLDLTTEERAALLPSGPQTIFANRLAWAKTYLTEAG